MTALVRARELTRVGARVRVPRPIGVAFEGDGRYADDGALREPPFEVVVSRFPFGQPEPPSVVVDHDVDMILVVEGRGAALEGRIVEVPCR